MWTCPLRPWGACPPCWGPLQPGLGRPSWVLRLRTGPSVCPPSQWPQHPWPCGAAPTDKAGAWPLQGLAGGSGCPVQAWPGSGRLCGNGGLCVGRAPRPPLLSWLTMRRSSTGATVCGRAMSRRCFLRSPRMTWRPSGCARRPSCRLRCGRVHTRASWGRGLPVFSPSLHVCNTCCQTFP